MEKLLTRLAKYGLTKRFNAWLDRRIPPAAQVTLAQRSIFIVPSKAGWMFGLLLVLLLITAINYQNSLIYGLVFWLFSLGLSAMIFSYRNLSGLTIKAGNAVNGFAGKYINVPFRLSAAKRDHFSLTLSWQTVDKNLDQGADSEVLVNQETQVAMPLQLQTRGYLKTPRLKIQTHYPFGLYTCWTWVTLKTPGIVYPKAIKTPFIASEGGGSDLQTEANLIIGNDEFIGLRSYQAGDSLKHIAWKYLAKGKGLLTKEYDNQQLSMQWLDWQSLQGKSEESRLSHLTGWVLQAEQENRAYGLKLPGLTIAPSHGDSHRQQCLEALALYKGGVAL